jgi:hypothetical protein
MAKSEWMPISRRQLGKGAAAVGATAAMAGGATSFVQAAGDTLRVRNYSDIQVLDPAYILSAPETDVNVSATGRHRRRPSARHAASTSRSAWAARDLPVVMAARC